MNNVETTNEPTIAISISDSPDLPLLGMGERHVHHAMNSMATHLLGYGYRLAYGDDLRQNGFADELFEIAYRYRDQPDIRESTPRVTDYLAFPVWIDIHPMELEDLSDRLSHTANVVCLSIDGEEVQPRNYFVSRLEESQVATAFTAMRKKVLEESDARVVLGGRVNHYRGCMPSIAEDALLTLEKRAPLYLLGGFGGCARDIAQTMGLVKPISGASPSKWEQLDVFSEFADGGASLNNGLETHENATLAQTPYIDEAIKLIVRGLERLKRRH